MCLREKRIIQALEDKKVDYIAIMWRPTPEHGRVHFGVDYAHDIVSWVKTHYERKILIGSDPLKHPKFGVAIYKRKVSVSPL